MKKPLLQTLFEGVLAVVLVALGLAVAMIVGRYALLLVTGVPSGIVAVLGVLACFMTHHFTARHHTRPQHQKGETDEARRLPQDRRTPSVH